MWTASALTALAGCLLLNDATASPPPVPQVTGLEELAAVAVETAPRLTKGSSLLGARVHDASGAPIGRLGDLVIDEHGGIVVALVEGRAPGLHLRSEEYLPVPIESLRLEQAELDRHAGVTVALEFRVALTIDDLSRSPTCSAISPLDEPRVDRVYALHGLPEPFPLAPTLADPDAPGVTASVHDSRLAASVPGWRLVSKLLGRGVLGDRDAELGRFNDLALSLDERAVVYVVILRGDSRRYALPWSAFDLSGATPVVALASARFDEVEGFRRWPVHADDGLVGRAPSPPTARHIAGRGPR